ncbi:beta-1,3-galactosyltransferase 5-like [Rhagoletis pomonella]|uniref:beta-1,3-galactosyltransferase 5-like n=1 Tax=Rhagoletis pomonella TaxID=28610 RepID=UPI00177DF257|nr:beta-1,3-galactosyltransferase 5-like [Rhagoletis pomonella]
MYICIFSISVVGSISYPNASSANNGAQQDPLKSQSQVQLDQLKLTNGKSSDNVNNLNKILDSDVMVPTSNLQKFIENADKILRNITALPTANEKLSSKDSKGSKQLTEENTIVKAAKVEDIGTDEEEANDDGALPPSVVMTIKRPGSASAVQQHSNENRVVKKVETKVTINKPKAIPKVQPASHPVPRNNTDHTKGIPTSEIYESGHLNEEINFAKICPNQGDDLKLLILISSAVNHAEARLAIRQTWAHYGTRRDVSIAFVLGRTTNESVSKELSIENFIYGDVIRGNFIDSYTNLTLKTISTLEWVDLHCQHAKFILKTDDDMFINVPKLLQFIDGHSKNKRVIYGRLAKQWKPIRNKKSKYYVSTDQFSQPLFPPFTTGPAYLLTSDVIHMLYEKCLHQVYLKLEDVFTTGIVAQQLGIKRVHANEFLNRRIAFNPCNIRKLISVHMVKSNEQFDLWKKLLDKSTKCK